VGSYCGDAPSRRAISIWFLVSTLFLTPLVGAQSLPELFQKCKEEVKSGAWQDALKTLDTLEAKASQSGNENARGQLAAPLAFYRGVCEANLGRTDKAVEDFRAFLKAQPNASIDAKVYSTKAVAAFEEAQKEAAKRAPSLEEAYEEFQPPKDTAERDRADAYWADGPIRWILTPEEKKAWSALADANARVAFVEQFWTARAKLPGEDGRTYQQEFERRVAFADAYLAEQEEQRGSVTDRGMVFILMGPPTYAGRRPLRTGDDKSDDAGMSTEGSRDAELAQKDFKATHGNYSSGQLAAVSAGFGGPGKQGLEASQNSAEVWHYRKELLPKGARYQQVDFEFVTKKGYGANVLQRDPETVDTLAAAQRLAAPGKGQ
jgi:GWxTD domain-containing protein